MLRRAAVLAVVLAACALATEAQTPPSLIVQRAGPNGEIDSLDQAKEIRIVFSEPMVALGRIPQPVEVSFVRIEPAIRGAFRWSGTTILIFTPDPRQPLPYATPYQVTVDHDRESRERAAARCPVRRCVPDSPDRMASARLLAASVLLASRIGGWLADDVAGRVPNVGRRQRIARAGPWDGCGSGFFSTRGSPGCRRRVDARA